MRAVISPSHPFLTLTKFILRILLVDHKKTTLTTYNLAFGSALL